MIAVDKDGKTALAFAEERLVDERMKKDGKREDQYEKIIGLLKKRTQLMQGS